MLVLAHRGLSAHYPENTEIAFKKALEAGAKAIECDVHQVGQQFVIFHDYCLRRLTGQAITLNTMSAQDLSQVRIAKEHSILSLEALFEIVNGQAKLNLELKSIDSAPLFIDTLLTCDDKHPCDVVLSSFNHPLLNQIRPLLRNSDIESRLEIAALVGHLPLDNAQYALDLGADIAAIDANLVTKDFVAHAHKNGLKVWCYTVNSEALLRRLQSFGVDSIFSDDVEWANRLLTEGETSEHGCVSILDT